MKATHATGGVTILIRAYCDGCVARGIPPFASGIVAGPDAPRRRVIRLNRAPVGWLPLAPKLALCPRCAAPFAVLAACAAIQ